ncbi:MAG: DUF47 family protein [Oscillospiraceae bacterium]|nr:DUF47 family protein [Oscillospiraceae bacterium]
MAKGDKFYFENFTASTMLSKEGAVYLVNCLENYDTDQLPKMLGEIHDIEHRADMKKHEMNAALAKAFVTPIDREDLDMLSHKLDDVIDEIEEVLQIFYMYHIRSVKPVAIEFAKKIVKTCDLLCAIMGEFENFKKSKKIKQLIIEMHDMEEECDKLYLSSMHDLVTNSTDVMETIAWQKIYEGFEACADACEHAGECVDTVIMKNT